MTNIIEPQDTAHQGSSHHSSKINNSELKGFYAISIYYQNVRGLNTKISFLNQFPDYNTFNILALTETWLTDNVPSHVLFPVSIYNIFRQDRTSKRGGRVLLAINVDLNVKTIPMVFPSHLISRNSIFHF